MLIQRSSLPIYEKGIRPEPADTLAVASAVPTPRSALFFVLEPSRQLAVAAKNVMTSVPTYLAIETAFTVLQGWIVAR